MTSIYSYILRYDEGATPNPFWGMCTLTICKPAIRRNAQINDWIVGTGSKNAKCNDGKIYDLSDSLVYAMKISDIKSIEDYDVFCKKELPNKIPNWRTDDWRLRVGDCIYDFSNGGKPTIRKSVHNESNRKRDLSGVSSLLSNHFYYFGEEARPLPNELKQIIKTNQGHRKIENELIVKEFENWISQFDKNKIYANPQMRSLFDKKGIDRVIKTCSNQHSEDDKIETEETIC